jgi:hypothetical protein
LASKEDQNIYDVDSVPNDFTLSDPDHLNAFEINNLYNHWMTRQNLRLAPFIILNPAPHHEKAVRKSEKAKGKKKAPYVDVSSDDEEEGGNSEMDNDVDFPGRFSSSMKFGPPVGSQKEGSSSKQRFDDPVPIAGPSNVHSPEVQLKKGRGKANDGKVGILTIYDQ